ncbi:hypothetical protein UPYG_G00059390 [Umbra pygmaea]|uniref:ATP synthase F0 subunit 8 n=1 Tax=Umbra pygmaea TaxID=75934 RepID=A0ABD0X8Z6_UMBPY
MRILLIFTLLSITAPPTTAFTSSTPSSPSSPSSSSSATGIGFPGYIWIIIVFFIVGGLLATIRPFIWKYWETHPPKDSSFLVSIFGIRPQGQQRQQGTPNVHINQLRLGDAEAFRGQVGCIIPPPSPGFSQKPPSSWTGLEHLPREAPMGYPYQMPIPT